MKHKKLIDKRIVMFVGPNGVGKTTLANRLAKEMDGARVSCADAVRDLWRMTANEDPYAVKSRDPERYREEMAAYSKFGRLLFGENVWALTLVSDIDKLDVDYVFIDDVRSAHEYEIIKNSFTETLLIELYRGELDFFDLEPRDGWERKAKELCSASDSFHYYEPSDLDAEKVVSLFDY